MWITKLPIGEKPIQREFPLVNSLENSQNVILPKTKNESKKS